MGEIKPFLPEGWKTVEQNPIEKAAFEISKLDLSNCGMARFLDSNYSIDTLINWLESKQLDIPYAVFKFADEVKSWMPELKPQAEPVPNAGAGNDDTEPASTKIIQYEQYKNSLDALNIDLTPLTVENIFKQVQLTDKTLWSITLATFRRDVWPKYSKANGILKQRGRPRTK